MNDAQKHILNLMIDSMRTGSRVLFIMPRKMGTTQLKQEIERERVKLLKEGYRKIYDPKN